MRRWPFNRTTGLFYFLLYEVLFSLFRRVAGDVKERGLKPSVADAMLRTQIEAANPEDTAESMAMLPARKARLLTFSRKRNLNRNEEISPTEIPEELFVSYRCSPNFSFFSGF